MFYLSNMIARRIEIIQRPYEISIPGLFQTTVGSSNTACRWLRLPHRMYGTELKNMMERFIQHIKDRTECF